MTREQSTNEAEQDSPPDFAVTLMALHKGKTLRDLSQQLAELTKAVTATKKNGKLQLTITMKPAPADGALYVTADIRASVPKRDQQPSIFYATDEGELVRNDPNQPSLFREITTKPKETSK